MHPKMTEKTLDLSMLFKQTTHQKWPYELLHGGGIHCSHGVCV